MKKITKEDAIKELAVFTDKFESVILSTVSNDCEPFASYSPFVKDESGNFYVFVSTAVAHSHNMNATKKAHIMFLEDESKCDHIYARKRLYYNVDCEKFDENDSREEEIHDLFKKKFGDKVSFFSAMKDFRFYKLIPKDGSLVLGFGAAYKIAEDGKSLKLNDMGHSQTHEKGLGKKD